MAAPFSHRALCGSVLFGLAACTNDFAQFDFSGSNTGGNAASSADAAPVGAGGAQGAGGHVASGGVPSGGSDSGPTTGGIGSDSGTAGAGGGMSNLDAGGSPDADAATPGDPDSALAADAAIAAETGSSPDAQDRCNSLYGSAPAYVACSSTSSSCVFSANTGGGNCDSLCASFGGTCLDADDNDNRRACVPSNTSDDCLTVRMNTICTCSNP